jgi:hypothetical protein
MPGRARNLVLKRRDRGRERTRRGDATRPGAFIFPCFYFFFFFFFFFAAFFFFFFPAEQTKGFFTNIQSKKLSWSATAKTANQKATHTPNHPFGASAPASLSRARKIKKNRAT